ncbi:MAG: hypothetical protein NT056_04190, partial [Proteobacteria bacterium]|nr:hypothetical protein [Pseudomonadota bacterium]
MFTKSKYLLFVILALIMVSGAGTAFAANPVRVGCIPFENITDSKDFWNAWDAAADNYPFMVLTSSILMPEFFKGKALDMLKT